MLLLTKRKYFDAIKEGKKTVDIRKATGLYKNAKIGSEILFMCGRQKFTRKIKEIYRGTLEEILEKVGFKEIIPWAESREEFIENLREIYPKQEEFVAFRIG